MSVGSRLRRGLALRFVDWQKRTHMVRNYHQQMESQWRPADELERAQREKIQRLLRHAYHNVPYYKRVFDKVGFKPEDFKEFGDLRALPILTKAIIRDNFEALQARNKQDFAPRRNQTSGSTGQPLVFFWDRDAHSCGWPNAWRAFAVAGFQLGDPLLILSGGALMPKVTPLRQRIYYQLMGITQLRAYHLSEEEMAGYLTYLQGTPGHPKYLYGYASAAYLFARYLISRGASVQFKAVFTTAEVLPLQQRGVIERGFGCRVFDTYGNNESCLAAFECEQHTGLHYAMENAFLEVVDERGEPVGEGETGRLIGTNLENYAMPFIRYDSGDLGRLTREPCACGRGLLRIGNIMGRARDFIYTPDGREIHGAFFNHFEPFYRTPWIAGWHVLQDRIDHLVVTIRPDGEPVEADVERMLELMHAGLGEDMRIDVVYDSKLHTTPAGKQKVIECLIERPGAGAGKRD